MPARSFKSLFIAVSGTIPGHKQADIKTLVEEQGSTFMTVLDNTCTHLITTQKEVERKGTKYQAACKIPTCKIVNVDWLVSSCEAKKVLPEKAFLLSSDSNSDAKMPMLDGTSENPKKRAIKEEDDDDAQKSKKSKKDSQKSHSKPLNIPVDEGFFHNCPFKGPQYAHVYVSSDGLIWDATLNQTDSGKNNNKFYRVQLIASDGEKEFVAWTRWGRVGEFGQFSCLGHGSLEDAKRSFEKKFKDKSGLTWENRLDPPKKGKYTFIERDYEDDEDDTEETVTKNDSDEVKIKVESTLTKPLQSLMSFIFNPEHFQSTLASMSYDAQKLPLGKLSERTLKAGFTILKELAELIATPNTGTDWQQSLLTLSNRYFTTIPHVFGRNRPPILNSDALIKKEVELLDALTDMDVANEIMKDSKLSDINELDRQFQGLGMKEMTQLDHNGTEYNELIAYLNNSRGATHNLKYNVIDIFRIERQGEHDRFTSSPFAKLKNSDRRLLWHGSRSTNFGGILSQGLRIAPPEAPANGYMFGKGVYLADTSTKSANYCCPYNSGNTGLLLLCDAELGDPMLELVRSDYSAGENAKSQGKIATLGQGRCIPGGWKDAGCLTSNLKGVKMPDVAVDQLQNVPGKYLMYNEYIVYDVAQIRQRYLFYVHMS
ncbi:hypothetical protein N7490_005393 [Penicillium lividum]|nr:hypothetical protein N7490_005393 [Penicillium lividum]